MKPEDAASGSDASHSRDKSTESDLYHELLRLRSRRGVARSDLAGDIGPAIRALSDVRPSDRESSIRQSVVTTLGRLIDGLPPDLDRAARLAFALDKEHLYPSLDERVKVLADQQGFSERTARRLMDRAVQAMVGRADTPPAVATSDRPAWRVASLKSLFRLDTPTPELYEMRTIVAAREISEVTLRLGLPPATGGAGPKFEALFGARVTAVEHHPTRNHHRVVLSLGRTLGVDELHELWLHVILPPDQPTWSHYAIVPLNPCDAGIVRVRFSPTEPPSRVWLLDEVPYLDLTDDVPGPEPIIPDANGEVVRDFHGLREGYGYGVAWTP